VAPAGSLAEERERQVTWTVLAMASAFAFVWTPYAISAARVVVEVAGGGQQRPANGDAYVIQVAPVICAKTSTFLTPFIYVWLNPHVRTFSANKS